MFDETRAAATPGWDGRGAPSTAPPSGPARNLARRAEVEAAPYLGPVPTPSLTIGRALIGFCLLGAALRLTVAFRYLQLAALDRRLLDAPTFDLATDARSNADAIQSLTTVQLLSWVALFALLVYWQRSRRPAPTLAAHGETHVETTIGWVTPVWLRLLQWATIGIGLWASFGDRGDSATARADLPAIRTRAAMSFAAFAGYWLLKAVTVVISEQHLRNRLALSTQQREGLAPATYVAPLDELQLTTANGEDLVRPGWIFRSAGLFILVVGGVFAVLAGVGIGTPTGFACAAAGVMAVSYAVRSILRSRRGSSGPPPSAQPAPLVNWPGDPNSV